jgi:subtilisin family serine protease
VVAPRFQAARQIEVVVQMIDAPLAAAVGRNAKQRGGNLNSAQQRTYLNQLAQKQETLMGQIRNLGGREIARVRRALNAVIISIHASQIEAVSALPNVLSVRLVKNYEMVLGDTVPYIGAGAVQGSGFDGTGVRVAILDSGIDYTHRNFGGSGTSAAYTAAYGTSTSDLRNTTTDGLFPTLKVIGGYDFVGEAWPSGPLAPDPDPIDCGPSAIPAPCAGGHGTHVADIAGGRSSDGTHKGVAPGASLYAVKVCSAVSTSCSGIALLQGIDFALDPNGDGDISDAVDVINMSIGSAYGQIEDDLSFASAIASRFGVVVVAAAGNNADRQYIVASPSSAPEVISVAQTQVPSASQQLMRIVSPSSIAGDYIAVFQPWSAPLTSIIQAPVQYGNGAGGNLLGCTAFPAGSLTGKIVLVDRGTCAFSVKISNIATGNGQVGIIGLVAAGEPFAGAFGGGTPTIPGFMISQANANLIKSQLATGVTARFDPTNVIPLAGSMVSSSSRGPSYSSNAIKPDIGAPGASISAEAGTGTGQTAFGGTSGASPMVAGSAALLVQAYPTRTPAEIKSALMNTAEKNITTNPVTAPGVLAPITRIGGGEVRVDRAFQSTTAAWDALDATGSLSFGYNALTDSKAFQRDVVVRNYGHTARTYSISSHFRYANDAASGAVSVEAPSSINVPANSSNTFRVKLKVDVTKLPTWQSSGINGGSTGGDGFRLQAVEFDGFLNIWDSTDTVHLPWQILPHRAAEVTPASNNVTLSGGTGSLNLSNAGGAVAGRVDVFSLLGTSGRIPNKFSPEAGDNFAIVDLKSVGVRAAGSSAIQFAINTFGERAHPNYPAEFDILIDADRNGTDDFVIFNLELTGFGATGQNVVAAGALPSGPFFIRFFTDADLNSGNVILTALNSDIGITSSTQFNFSVFSGDNYFTGFLTDAITGMTYTAGTARFVGSNLPSTGVPAGGSSTLTIQAVPGGDVASPSQKGLLLMYRDARLQREADQIVVQ